MKDDTVRRLQALENEFALDPAGEGQDGSLDELAGHPVRETVRGDAA